MKLLPKYHIVDESNQVLNRFSELLWEIQLDKSTSRGLIGLLSMMEGALACARQLWRPNDSLADELLTARAHTILKNGHDILFTMGRNDGGSQVKKLFQDIEMLWVSFSSKVNKTG